MVLYTKLEGVEDSWAGCRFTYDAELVSEIKTLLRVNHGDKTKVFQIIWDDSERPDVRRLPREAAFHVLSLIDQIAAFPNG